MEQKHFEYFQEDVANHVELVRLVGSIQLKPNSGRTGYILASIDVLSRALNQVPGQEILESTLKDVVKYRLWNWGEEIRPYDGLPISANTIHLRREIIETIAHLNSNGLIDSTLGLTKLGKSFLMEATIPETLSHYDQTFSDDVIGFEE